MPARPLQSLRHSVSTAGKSSWHWKASCQFRGRLQPLEGRNGSTLFDDSYNANPLSVCAAAEFLANLEGKSWLVLGDMKELGAGAKEMHREVGASARASGIDRLFALGDLSKILRGGIRRAEDSSETGYEETLIVFGRAAFIFKQLERAKDGYRVLPETDAARQMKNIMKDLVKHLAAVFSPLEYPDCDLEDELIAEYLDCDLEDELIAEYKHRAAAVNPNHEEHYAIYGDSDDSAII